MHSALIGIELRARIRKPCKEIPASDVIPYSKKNFSKKYSYYTLSKPETDQNAAI